MNNSTSSYSSSRISQSCLPDPGPNEPLLIAPKATKRAALLVTMKIEKKRVLSRKQQITKNIMKRRSEGTRPGVIKHQFLLKGHLLLERFPAEGETKLKIEEHKQ